jgi:DNA-binding transcriptional ArsR family regulator
MPFPATIEQPAREAYRVSLDSVRNAIASMMFVTKGEEMPGVSPWVAQTRAKLSAEELFKHRLVIIGFYFTFQPERDWNSFPEYLDALEKTDPVAMREKMLKTYAQICKKPDAQLAYEEVDWDQVLSSVDNYIDFLRGGFDDVHIEIDVETRAYEYLFDPPAMKELIVDHLRWFWNEHLAPEWARTEQLLRESVKAFRNANFDNMSRLEIIRYVTGQEIDEDKWKHTLEGAHRIVFTPNPHVGPYVTRMYCGDQITLVFGARQPDDASVRIPELDRADIVARMSALADDTRLRILQMIAESGELRSQDIMVEVELSQPSVSRYLTQLTATGYLQERRVNGSKAYSLNRDRIGKTLKAVHKFLLGSN